MDDGTVTHITVDQTHEEIVDYWTEERMADAKPMELLLPKPDADRQAEDD